jgi:hypothetical protein
MKIAQKIAAVALCLGLVIAPTMVSKAACKDKDACSKTAAKKADADCCKKGTMSKKEDCCKDKKSMTKAEVKKNDTPKQ